MAVYDKKIWNDCAGYNAENWLHISKDTNISTVSVVGAKGTIYSDGELIPEDEVLTITVTPKSNYTIKSLLVNGSSFENGGTITVKTAISIVTESTNKYVLSIDGDVNTTLIVTRDGIALEDDAEITYGDVLTISAVANTGYELSSLTVNGTAFTSGNTHTVVGAVAVVAASTIQQFTLSLETDQNTTLSVTRNGIALEDEATINYGDVLTITATPEDGYQSLLEVNGSSFTSGDTVTVTSNIAVSATSVLAQIQAFSVNDTVSRFRFDTSLSVAEIKTILSGLSYQGAEVVDNRESINLLVGTGELAENGQLIATRVNMGNDTYEYVLVVFQSNSRIAEPIYVWSSVASAEAGLSLGFQNLTDDYIVVQCTVAEIYQGNAWNGIIAGK